MITEQYLSDQIEQSKRNRKSTLFLRRFVFRVVDAALREVYGDNYSIRCLQSSVAIQELLTSLGISSKVFLGAVCLSRVSKVDPKDLSWAGFWGEDHHVWVATEWNEYVDLTIAQLHLHPVGDSKNDEPIPAIWWHPADRWPPIIRYIPTGLAALKLESNDAQNLERLKSAVVRHQAEVMRVAEPTRMLFEPVLFGPDHANDMAMQGHPWLQKSLRFQELGIPFPDWIINREQELIAELRRVRIQ